MDDTKAIEKTPNTDAIKLSCAALCILSFACLSWEEPWLAILPFILFAGFLTSIMTGNTFYIKVAVRITQTAAVAILAGLVVYLETAEGMIIHQRVLVYVAFTSGVVVGILLLNYLLLNPSRRFIPVIRGWALANISKRASSPTAKIISRDSLVSFSHADELKKWSGLFANGTISEEEFARVKNRLLGNQP